MMVLIQFIVVGLFAALVKAKMPFEFHAQKVNCLIRDPKVVELVICSVKAINRTTTYINIGLNITQNLTTLMLNAQLLKKNNFNYKPFLINVTEDLCEFFGKNRGGFYLRLVSRIYQPYSNFKHPCPYIGYHYAKDLPVDENKLPIIWPFGLYQLDMALYEETKPVFVLLRLFFELKERVRH